MLDQVKAPRARLGCNRRGGFERICEALARLARRQDVQLVYPVHRNPHAMDLVYRRLGGLANVFLIEPLDYVPFVDLMRHARLLITDSGGIQEEGPSLGKPILVMASRAGSVDDEVGRSSQ